MMLKTEIINNGLPGKIGISNYALLTVIAANADKEGVCKMKMIDFAQIMDVSPKAISRKVNELFKLELNDRPIVQRVSGGLQISLEILGEQNRPVNISNKYIYTVTNSKGISASTVLNHFGNKYLEAYGCQYSFMFKRDLSLVKNKLLNVYGAENTLKIIDEAFRQRSLFENPPRYPYITIGALVTFIANKVMTDIKQHENRESFHTAAFNKEMQQKHWDEYFGD